MLTLATWFVEWNWHMDVPWWVWLVVVLIDLDIADKQKRPR
jgi:hypothetical protein